MLSTTDFIIKSVIPTLGVIEVSLIAQTQFVMSVSRAFNVTCVINCGINPCSIYCDTGLCLSVPGACLAVLLEPDSHH